MKREAAGIWYAVAAYLAWGFLPAYWKLLKDIPSAGILAHRIFWSFVLVAIVLLVLKRWNALIEAVKQRSNLMAALASSILISSNWFIYIWAVNHNHIIEASLGYYINPLISILLGMVVLRERLTFRLGSSLALATIGVLILTVELGQIPWVSLFLAISFGLYGLAKKLLKIDALIGLTLETLFVFPLALWYILSGEANGTGTLGTMSFSTWGLLIGTGIATALPLLWFAEGAKRVPLTTLGFIQYLSPSISLVLGIFIYKESFSTGHLVSFGFIWAALLLFTLSNKKLKLPIHAKLKRKAS